MKISKTESSRVDAYDFIRDSEAYWLSKIWKHEIPVGVRTENSVASNQASVEQAFRGLLASSLCFSIPHKEGHGTKMSVLHRRGRQINRVTKHYHYINCQYFEVLADSARAAKERGLVTCLEETAAKAKSNILRDLEAMMEEQNEPDFQHRPTDYAYEIARQTIESAYTHYLGSAPVPTFAPDGDGGLVVEWRVGRRVVRLAAPASKTRRSYIYSRSKVPSQIDYSASGDILAARLRTIFVS